MKTLYIIAKGMDKLSDEEISVLEKKNVIPRVMLLQHAVSADLLDERFLENKAPFMRRILYKVLPASISQLIEALFILRFYDVILSHSEKVSLPLALVMKFLNIRKPHIVILSRITSVDESKSKQKIWFLKKTKDFVTCFLIWSSMQRKIAIEKFGVSPDKIILLKRGVDQQFWKPGERERETDMICSAGMEVRDYPTLVEALRPLRIPCHIAAGATRGELFNTVKELHNIKDMPEFITVAPKKSAELRNLYARSRFVVVSLLPSDSDNGLTTILESMAMGKTVICSKTEGQIDVIKDGITGIYVPQGDPEALRMAIMELWNDPERCVQMGETARAYIENHHTMEQFVQGIKYQVELSVNGPVPEKAYRLEHIEA